MMLVSCAKRGVQCVMQVLNMKPVEILAMLEEVAGTRMYEEKRVRAFQTFEKKTQKLKEFDEVEEDACVSKRHEK